MKKIIACISLVFAMSAGVTALAADADYVKDGNSYTGEIPGGYTTVLIEKDAVGETPSEIVFVDQNDSGLGTAANFLLKGSELADGTYTVTLGGSSTAESSSSTFTVTSTVPVTVPMDVTNKEEKENGSYDYGFFGKVSAKDCGYIAITVTKGDDTKTGYYESPFAASGEGEVNAAVKITGVPSGYDVSVALTNVNE